MATILSVLSTAPKFSSTAPAPTPVNPLRLKRSVARVGTRFVEFMGEAPPTLSEVDAFITAQAARAITQARVDDISADLAGLSLAGKTLADLRAMTRLEFRAFWGTLTVAQKDGATMFLLMAALHRLL